jgi:thiamine-phosphate pyrophosphorylase
MALPHGIYAIVDATASRSDNAPASRHAPLELVAAFVKGGAAVVQLRLKQAGAGELLRIAREAKLICAGKALLLINDRPDVAKLAKADGVHLGQDDLPLAEARALLGPSAIIGISTHSDEELQAAQGADYVGFGPIFATRSKPGAALPPPHGLEGLRRAVQLSKVPVVAIGGLTAATAQAVAATGARCAAAIAELCNASDPEAAVRAMATAFGSQLPAKTGNWPLATGNPEPTGDRR